MSDVARKRLQKGIKSLFILAALFMVYILTDFSFNMPVPKSYQFRLPQLDLNTPVLLKQGTLIIVIARYDSDSIAALQSDSSADKPVIPAGEGATSQNSYFVAMGYGTLLSCPLEIHESYFSESCSEARYDLLGRSFKKQHYPNLKIPQYTFNHDFSLLTIE